MKLISSLPLVLFVCWECSQTAGEDVTVSLEGLGQMVGLRERFNFTGYPPVDRDIDVFRGIGYAEPPVGELRLAKTKPKQAWTPAIYNARRLRSRCWAWRNLTIANPLKDPQAEDCLYLNIWTPKAEEGLNHAVLIWIHGGGFDWGSGTTKVYEGDALTAYNDVVVVTLNYRLNGFGFLSTADRVMPGNFGIWDQNVAIDWVHTHISKFGGDPDRITLFGQSAGAGSVGFHIVSPHSQDLFNNGVLMSGSPYWVSTATEAYRNSAFRAGRNLGCGNLDMSDLLLECLQSINETAFAMEMISTPAGPILDKDFFPDTPDNIIKQRKAKPCEIMLGTTKDDGSLIAMFLFVDQGFTDDPQCNRERWLRNVQRYSGGNDYVADAIDLQYSNWSQVDDPDANYFYDFIAMSTDTSTCGQEPMAREWAQWDKDVYRYVFAYEPSNSIYPRVPTWKGVAHGDEMQFIFGNQFQTTELDFLAEEFNLSLDMMRYYSNFAKTGNPNEGGDNDQVDDEEPYWPKFQLPERIFKAQTPEMLDVPAYRADYCALWNRFIPRLETFTGSMASAYNEWKSDFSTWSDVWMNNWRTEFGDYQEGSTCP